MAAIRRLTTTAALVWKLYIALVVVDSQFSKRLQQIAAVTFSFLCKRPNQLPKKNIVIISSSKKYRSCAHDHVKPTGLLPNNWDVMFIYIVRFIICFISAEKAHWGRGQLSYLFIYLFMIYLFVCLFYL